MRKIIITTYLWLGSDLSIKLKGNRLSFQLYFFLNSIQFLLICEFFCCRAAVYCVCDFAKTSKKFEFIDGDEPDDVMRGMKWRAMRGYVFCIKLLLLLPHYQ